MVELNLWGVPHKTKNIKKGKTKIILLMLSSKGQVNFGYIS